MHTFLIYATLTPTCNLVVCSRIMVHIPESLIIILFCFYIDSFKPPYYGGIAMLFCSYLTDTFNNSLGTS